MPHLSSCFSEWDDAVLPKQLLGGSSVTGCISYHRNSFIERLGIRKEISNGFCFDPNARPKSRDVCDG